MPDCELMPTCPFFNDEFQEAPEMTAALKEEYCRGEYAWCGRYLAFKFLEQERKRAAAGLKENKEPELYGSVLG